MTTKVNEIMVTIPIPETTLNDLLITAIEGGLGDWATDIELVPLSAKPFNTGNPLGTLDCIRLFLDPITPNARSMRTLHVARRGLNEILPQQIYDGLVCMAKICPAHFGNIVTEDFDAETADAFVQCCIFGEIRYG